RSPWRVDDADGLEAVITKFIPHAHEAAAGLARQDDVAGLVSCFQCAQNSLRHAVLSPYAIDVRVGREQVRHRLLPGRLVPTAVSDGENLDACFVKDAFSHLPPNFVRGVS